MTFYNWVIAIIAGVIGGLCTAANWLGLIRWFRTKKSYSQIMFIGGILICICLYNLPISKLWWIGLLIDPGVWIGIYSLPSLLREMFRNSD